MAFAPASSTPRWRFRYSLICSCIDGKMRACASCSVLSRSKIHTRRKGGNLEILTSSLLASNEGADALVGEHFQQQRVRHPAVDDVHALHAVARGVARRAAFPDHATRDHAIFHQVVDYLRL